MFVEGAKNSNYRSVSIEHSLRGAFFFWEGRHPLWRVLDWQHNLWGKGNMFFHPLRKPSGPSGQLRMRPCMTKICLKVILRKTSYRSSRISLRKKEIRFIHYFAWVWGDAFNQIFHWYGQFRTTHLSFYSDFFFKSSLTLEVFLGRVECYIQRLKSPSCFPNHKPNYFFRLKRAWRDREYLLQASRLSHLLSK